MGLRPSRAPLWFTLGVAVVLACAIRLLLPDGGAIDDAPGHAPRVQYAFWFFFIVIAEAIWKGLEVAARITLVVLHWMVLALYKVVALLGNGLKSAGHLLLQALKRGWEFTRKLYDDVLKPALTHLWKIYKKFTKWMDDTFGPVLKFLKTVRKTVLDFWRIYVRPWLDLIDVTRKVMRVLGSLGINWARALDARLGSLETLIERPFRLLLAKINEIINVVNRVITLDGLIQRVALIRSIARDYKQVWANITKPYSRELTAGEEKKTKDALTFKAREKVVKDFTTVLDTGGGDDGAVVAEWAAQLRIYLRSRSPTGPPDSPTI